MAESGTREAANRSDFSSRASLIRRAAPHITPATALSTGMCIVRLRMSGAKFSIVTCDGRPPKFYGEGRVTLAGLVRFRGTAARSEFGATKGGELVVGSEVGINHGVSIVAAHRIEIGDYVRFGDYSSVYDTNYHSVHEDGEIRARPVIIGTNVWIGRSCIILPGTTIGDHSVIGAGSVVRGEIPARSIVAGNPGQIVGEVRASDDWIRV